MTLEEREKILLQHELLSWQLLALLLRTCESCSHFCELVKGKSS